MVACVFEVITITLQHLTVLFGTVLVIDEHIAGLAGDVLRQKTIDFKSLEPVLLNQVVHEPLRPSCLPVVVVISDTEVVWLEAAKFFFGTMRDNARTNFGGRVVCDDGIQMIFLTLDSGVVSRLPVRSVALLELAL